MREEKKCLNNFFERTRILLNIDVFLSLYIYFTVASEINFTTLEFV